MQTLHERYAELVVLGVPCNQFGAQEPNSNGEIAEFARRQGATFPLLAKATVVAPDCPKDRPEGCSAASAGCCQGC